MKSKRYKNQICDVIVYTSLGGILLLNCRLNPNVAF